MATIFTKTYTIPVIAAVRTTCAGIRYTVETSECINVVIVNGSHIACTCGEAACSHIQIVTLRRATDAAKAARRATYEATFDLSYGDKTYAA